MKWFWFVILSFVVHDSIAQQGNPPIQLMSYNIRLDHAGDNENNWHHRKADMVEYLLEARSDFIGLQEALGHQLAFLVDHLPDYNYVGVGRDDGAVMGEYSPILYDSTEWSIAETNTFWLSATPYRVSLGWDAVCNRVCTYGLFVRKDNSDSILVLNTHFDHVGKVARTESIRLINNFIHQFEANLPIVLIGDFNFTPDNTNHKALSKFLTDSDSVKEDSTAINATYNGWKSDEEATRRIDYILCNDEVEIENYKVDHPKTKKQRQLSDHYPVIVEIGSK